MGDYVWLTPLSQQFLEKDYLVEGQTVDERVNVICDTAEQILRTTKKLKGVKRNLYKGFSKRFKSNFQKGWYSFSTPIWSNFGTDRGLPISCFGSTIEDNMESILFTQAEVGMMSKYGGGTSATFGNVRNRGAVIKNNGYSSGSVHFMQLFNNIVNVISQGSTRRGSFAAYLPVEHPDIEEFLTIKSEGSPLQDISFGITASDAWMQAMIDGDKVKRGIWAKVLSSRANTGYPYIIFIDNANKNTADVYLDKGMKITHSNLCTEIFLPDNAKESFVCDLSSMNIRYFDDWEKTDAVQLMTIFLDSVMTEFITKGEKIPFLERAVRFARRHRALGIGWFGWHSYLQSKMIPYESMEAKLANTKIAKHIQEKSLEASKALAGEYGEPEVLQGYGRRNTTTCAIAPTKSSAFIIGQESESAEANKANIVVKDLAKGKFTLTNKYLEKLLEEKGFNNEETRMSILKNGGSVQHLSCLTDHEKAVFKTFGEISQMEVIIQAAQRQRYIDQGQSLNLMIHPTVPIKDVNALIIEAWKLGVKSLYYQYSVNAAQAFSKNILACSSCEA